MLLWQRGNIVLNQGLAEPGETTQPAVMTTESVEEFNRKIINFLLICNVLYIWLLLIKSLHEHFSIKLNLQLNLLLELFGYSNVKSWGLCLHCCKKQWKIWGKLTWIETMGMTSQWKHQISILMGIAFSVLHFSISHVNNLVLSEMHTIKGTKWIAGSC